MKKDYYTILDIPRNATVDQIKKAFRTIALKHHPDKTKDSESQVIFTEANEAYETLSDTLTRSSYDYALSNALVINLTDTVGEVVDEYFNQFQTQTN